MKLPNKSKNPRYASLTYQGRINAVPPCLQENANALPAAYFDDNGITVPD